MNHYHVMVWDSERPRSMLRCETKKEAVASLKAQIRFIKDYDTVRGNLRDGYVVNNDYVLWVGGYPQRCPVCQARLEEIIQDDEMRSDW